MNKLNICLYVTASSSVLSHTSDFETKYQKIYRHIVSFLFENTRNKMAVSFSGPLFSWIEKEHSEFTQLLSKISGRKQTEVIGGGYYNPIFPLLFPQDRTGQIELMTSELRKAVGKRPRGMTLFNSIWDTNLVPCFYSCGMEYVFLDSSLIPKERRCFLPLIVNEQGKSLNILSVNREFIPNPLIEPKEYLRNLFDTINYLTKDDEYNSITDERVVVIKIDENQFEKLYNSNWLKKMYQTAQEYFTDSINITLPLEYLHRSDFKVNSYIPAGIQTDVAKWAKSPYKAQENNSNFQTTIFDFLLTYKRNHALYNRMLYISILVNQCKGDKIRKKIARERLWIAQSGEGYVCNPDGVFANNAVRQYAYRNLTEAEKLIREASGINNFKEDATNYDYNGDGLTDYIFAMKQHNSCVTPKGAQICELDVMHNTGNYADSPNRIMQFDKVDDKYERGFFVDHLFTPEQFIDYKKGTPSGNGIFSQVLFKEDDFDSYRHEIKLSGKGLFSQLNIPVTLKKKISANSNGFMVQYILKNEGPFDIKGNFVVESNFTQTDFSSAKANSYKVEVISNAKAETIDVNTSKSLRKISYVQVTDTSNDISFVYQPNEDCDLFCMPLVFRRPSSSSDIPQISGTAFVNSLCWNVELTPGMEIEKNIDFTIIIPKKRRQRAKTEE